MLRVVLDPGVLVAAVLSKTGTPAEALDAWREGEFDLIVSPLLLNELEEVLLRPKFRDYVTQEETRAYVEALAAEAVAFDDPDEPPRVTRDVDDDYLFALAEVAGADFVVSGDKDLLEAPDPPQPVLTPKAFLTRLRRAR